jgi:hypothetical protein
VFILVVVVRFMSVCFFAQHGTRVVVYGAVGLLSTSLPLELGLETATSKQMLPVLSQQTVAREIPAMLETQLEPLAGPLIQTPLRISTSRLFLGATR